MEGKVKVAGGNNDFNCLLSVGGIRPWYSSGFESRLIPAEYEKSENNINTVLIFLSS